jgi:hypothetical protein
MKKTNISHKNSDLNSILSAHLKGMLNLYRIKFISMFIIALSKAQTVNFSKLFVAFDTEVESSLRRIQRFIAKYSFNSDKWLAFLNEENIRYYIRIKNNFKVFIPHKNKTVKVFLLFNSYKINEFIIYSKIVNINGQLCYVSGCKSHKGEFLILVSYNKPENSKYYC